MNITKSLILKGFDVLIRQEGDKLRTLNPKKLKQLRIAIEDQSDHINTLSAHMEYSGLWKPSDDEISEDSLEPP